MTYFISGDYDITKELFELYYKPSILEAIKVKSKFVVGNASNIDKMAQKLLCENLPDLADLKVFSASLSRPKDVYDDILCIYGFMSVKEANAAMTVCSESDLVIMPFMKTGSNAARNILRRYTIGYENEKYINKRPNNYEFWKIITAK